MGESKMKKMMAAAMMTALVAGTASVTFAAANPFTDVPADHWAYDAVSQLAKDGVIEGYGDTTFRGNQSITRYEMAQMVAKAMAKSNVSAADKALIDKLAAEFSDELGSLGVRVANLERNADKVKWNGEMRYTYTSTREDTKAKVNKDELLLRLEPSAEVNANWKVKARLDSYQDMAKDSGAKTKNSNTSTPNGEVKLVQAYAQGTYKNFRTSLGKFDDVTKYDKAMMLNDQMSGAEVVFGNKLKATARAGRIDLVNDGKVAKVGNQPNDTANMQSLALTYGAGKLSTTAAYYHLDSADYAKNALLNAKKYSNSKEDTANIWEGAASYRFDKNVALTGAYAENTKADFFKQAWIAQLDYKGAKAKNPGSWGTYLAYRKYGASAVIDPITLGTGFNQKGWELGAQVAVLKNTVARVIYFDGKNMTTNNDVKKLFGRVEFFF